MGLTRGPILREQEQEQRTKLLGSPLVMAASNSVKKPNQTTTQQEPLPPPPPHLFHHDQHHSFHHQQQQQQQHHHQIQDNNQISFGMMQSSPSSSIPGNYLSKDSGAYDFGELDQTILHYFNGQADPLSVQDQRQNSSTSVMRHSSTSVMRPPTLNIFPSEPMHVNPSFSNSKASMELVSPQTGGSKGPSKPSMELANPRNNAVAASAPEPPKALLKRDNKNKGPSSSSEQEEPKTPDPKTLRRLAQNREAARKSRLRKKAYVQQLESSRIRLNQLEQELQRAKTQGIFFGGGSVLGGEQGLPVPPMNNSLSSEAAVFDVEYTRWLEEHHRLVGELRAAFHEHLPDNELRMFVDNCLAHFDQVMNLKSLVIKADMFYLVSGMWKTPAERCFMWVGGFKPSEVIKIVLTQIEPLTDQQILGICALQQTTHEAEEALTQGVESLNQTISDALASGSLTHPPNMNNYMGHMAIAMSKLSSLEGFVRQADTLRHQTIHRLHQILTTRQAARCFLSIAEYNHRLRALSSLWMARPRQE